MQWSGKSGYLVLCGDDDRTLKVYDASDDFTQITSDDTTRGTTFGFEINHASTDDDFCR